MKSRRRDHGDGTTIAVAGRMTILPKLERLSLPSIWRSVWIAAVVMSGCAHAPRSYVFSTPRATGQALDVLAQSLVKGGHRISRIDRQSAEIITYWEDTGYRFRETDDLEDETNVFLRFHVTMSDVGAERRVTVRADAERCVPYRAVATSSQVVSTCLDMQGTLPTQQRVLDALGARLSAALSSAERQPPSPLAQANGGA
jgi:hypothetical protein